MTDGIAPPHVDGRATLRRVLDKVSRRFGWAAGSEGGFTVYDDVNWEAFATGVIEGIRPWKSHRPLERVPVFAGRSVFAFAENYVAPGSERSSQQPLLFMKPPWSVAAEDESVEVREWIERGARVWSESELAIWIGPKGTAAGVTLANDVTMEVEAFEGQDHHLPFFKGLKGFCPCSSLLMPLDVSKQYTLEGYHNGKLLRRGTNGDEIHSWPQLLTWLTSWAPLAHGDIVLQGAPRRVRDREYTRPGDVFATVFNGSIALETKFV